MKLILASSSPRRAEVLRNAGFEFEVRPTAIDETLRAGESPGGYVRRLALEKARAAVEEIGEAMGQAMGEEVREEARGGVREGEREGTRDGAREAVREEVREGVREKSGAGDFTVVAADTVVVNGDEILLKPVSPADARRMLRALSGGVHEVHTGLAVIRAFERTGRGESAGHYERVIDEVTRVHFTNLSDADIDAYIASGEPFDKAGAYGIQSLGGRYVTRVEGCYFNVMGMPLARLCAMLRDGGQAVGH